MTDRTTRKNRIALLTERVTLLDKVRTARGLDEEQTNTLLEDMKELVKLKRIDRSEQDVLYFMYEYFSDEKNPENANNLIPLGTRIEDAPDFHRLLCEYLDEVSSTNITARFAWACPRGHAKSAYLSNCFPVHQIVFELRKYILIISETEGMARKFLEWISGQLKFNAKLREDFGEHLAVNKKSNEKDNQEAFLTKSGTLVESASMGKQLRGKRNGSYRPDLVILDDLESSKNTNTPELREKNLHWFNSVVMPIGDPARTAFVYMGTVVHKTGLLNAVLERADFDGKVFSAIVEVPHRDDLWQTFEDIYRDQDNPDRLDEAMDFYESHREEMDMGAKTLWQSRFPYHKLMMEKVNIGSRAFGSEFLNNPINEEDQIFKESMFMFFDYKDVPKGVDYFTAWDLAFGKSNRSDYNAIVTVARDRRTGVLYVVDAWARKCKAHEALEQAIEVMKKYRPKVFGVETVQAQFDFYRQLQERMPRERIYTTKLKPINTRTKKEEKIETLEPLFESGVVRLMKHQHLLQSQLLEFPSADHDDLPDCLAMAIDCAGGTRQRRSWHKKPAGL